MPDPTDHSNRSATEDKSATDRNDGWFDRFTQQMTIQQASAADIDKAIGDVRAHCTEGGQSPPEEFGDPRRYATTLAAELPVGSRSFDLRTFGILLLSMLALAILLASSVSLTQLQDGEVPVTLGEVLLVAVAVPGWAALSQTRWARRRPRDPSTPGRPAFDEKYWRALWLTLGLAGAGGALLVGLDQTLLTVSMFLLPALGLAVLATSQVLRLLVARGITDHGASGVTCK